MGITADVSNWREGDEFIAFAFGDFNSKTKGIIRTSDGDRYNANLAPQMQDKTADIPGADGQFYFGTQYKTQSFTVNFAFDNLQAEDIRELKRTFSGKELKELVFSESVVYRFNEPLKWKVYMAKVTSQPSLKYVVFDENGIEIYKGEGSVQFTAYWPYCRDSAYTNNGNTGTTDPSGEFSTLYNTVKNLGDIPAHFIFTAKEDGVNKIEIYDTLTDEVLCTIVGNNIRSWDSKTGIIKNSEGIIAYTGNGLFTLPKDCQCNFKIYHTKVNGQVPRSTYFLQFYNWYY